MLVEYVKDNNYARCHNPSHHSYRETHFSSCAAWIVSDLVKKHKDRFSSGATHMPIMPYLMKKRKKKIAETGTNCSQHSNFFARTH